MNFGTKVIHAGIEPDPATGAIMTPIYQTSTFARAAPGKHIGYEYSRTNNPTRAALETNLAALENGKYGVCFSSGVAASDAILRLCKPGDEVIVSSDLYGGSYRIMKRIFEPYGLKFKFFSFDDLTNLKHSLTNETRMVWLETPSNPLLRIFNLIAIAQFTRQRNIALVVDNTFATPYLQNPLDLGADIVMHSLSKYIGGHSDIIMGAVITKDDEVAKQLRFIQNACGAVPGPQDCFLALRGIKTLHVRMQRHCDNAQQIAEYLQLHPRVAQVYYPGLPNCHGHEVATQQMRGFGGVVSFALHDNTLLEAIHVMEKLQIFAIAESLGGVESSCSHPPTMSHASFSEEERHNMGLKNSLIRLSVGIEDVKDQINDLRQALSNHN